MLVLGKFRRDVEGLNALASVFSPAEIKIGALRQRAYGAGKRELARNLP